MTCVTCSPVARREQEVQGFAGVEHGSMSELQRLEPRNRDARLHRAGHESEPALQAQGQRVEIWEGSVRERYWRLHSVRNEGWSQYGGGSVHHFNVRKNPGKSMIIAFYKGFP